MPCSSRECKVADRYDGAVYKLLCWHDKCSCFPTDDKHESVVIEAACSRVDKLTLSPMCLSESKQVHSPIHVLVYTLTVSLFLITHRVSPTNPTAGEPLRLSSCILRFTCRGSHSAAATILMPAQQLLLTNFVAASLKMPRPFRLHLGWVTTAFSVCVHSVYGAGTRGRAHKWSLRLYCSSLAWMLAPLQLSCMKIC